jgi:hypothetical protein
LDENFVDQIRGRCTDLAQADSSVEVNMAATELFTVLERFNRGLLGGASLRGVGLLNSRSALSCIMAEPLRTKLFQAAVMNAVKECISRKGHCRLAYIGTGPAATLVLPIMTQLPADAVNITFIEGHINSFGLLQRLFMYGGFENHVEAVHNIDATNGNAAEIIGGDFDVVVTETMAQALLYEPQAAITLNLGQKILAPGGVWLPHKIGIDLELDMHGFRIQKPFFELSAQGIHGLARDFEYEPKGQVVSGNFKLDGWLTRNRIPQVLTSIKIDDEHELPSGSSVITRPWMVPRGRPVSVGESLDLNLSYLLGGISRDGMLKELANPRI